MPWIANGESGASVRTKLNSIPNNGTTAKVVGTGLSGLASALGAIVVDAGTGYSNGDVLTATGGTGTEPTFTVVSVDGGGAITDLALTTVGSLSVIPSDPTSTSVAPPGGSGATLTISWSYAPIFFGADTTSGYGFGEDGIPIINASGNPVAKFFGDEGGGPWSSYLIVEARADTNIEFYVGGTPDANGFTFGLQESASFIIYSSAEFPLLRVFSHGANNSGVLIHGDASAPKIQSALEQLDIGTSNGYPIHIDADKDVNIQGAKLIISTFTPAAANDTGKTGTVTWDSNFIYVCIDTDTWKRVAIATWP